ncbi:MAG: Protein DedA [Candidatus Celerinatantimonas neptuna]|nr:MAG: Protein DedA [Candidatus Celerinatantimonas neptuna]
MFLVTFIHWLMSPEGLVSVLGHNWLLGTMIVAMVIFSETGFVLFPFLPGDSLLFATGAFYGAVGHNVVFAIAFAGLGAFLGDTLNYLIGRSLLGQKLLHSRWVKPRHVESTHQWFVRYGGLTIIVARFIPIVRTFAPFIAGMTQMERRKFIAFNALGAVLWSGLILLCGFILGTNYWVKGHMQWVSLIIIILSLIPVMMHLPKFIKEH